MTLWGHEVCAMKWEGGYLPRFGKLGAKITFNPDYHRMGCDLDPLGRFSTSTFMVKKGLSETLRLNEYEGIPRFISGSLPDDWGNKVFRQWITQNRLSAKEISSLDKLAFIGNRGMGALEFEPASYIPENSSSLIIDELFEAAKDILSTKDPSEINLKDKPGVKELMSIGMSIGGQHPKAVIAIDETTGDIRSGQIDLPDSYNYYILKFNDSDLGSSEIEYLYYQLAKECNVNISNSRLVAAGGTNHFLTQRFDRVNGGKVHSATLNALAGNVSSYEEIFHICKQLRLPYKDTEELFRRMVFNYMYCVCDDHDKNHSFTMDRNGTWRLSPAYDLIFTVNHLNIMRLDRHAMTLNGKDRYVTRDELLTFGKNYGINNPGHIIEQILDTTTIFHQRAQLIGIDKEKISFMERFINEQVGKKHSITVPAMTSKDQALNAFDSLNKYYPIPQRFDCKVIEEDQLNVYLQFDYLEHKEIKSRNAFFSKKEQLFYILEQNEIIAAYNPDTYELRKIRQAPKQSLPTNTLTKGPGKH